jgi:hypothetical protein
VSGAKTEPGQLVRLTVRDYRLLREALVMADGERGGKMPEEWPEFDEMSRERWVALDKIRIAVYPRKRTDEPQITAPAHNAVPA